MERSKAVKLALLILMMRRRRRHRTAPCREVWARNWVMRRERLGFYNTLLRELNQEDPTMFRRYHRVDRNQFDELLSMIGPVIIKQDTNMRRSIQPGERLAITLRFLATGESFNSLAFAYRVGERTISAIVSDTCDAIYAVMKETYLKVPDTQAKWRDVAAGFQARWNYPLCVGALDGKHIAIKQPGNTGSEFYNYKHFFSVILMALVDSNYRFLYVDVGAPGRAGDAGVFMDSSLKRAMDEDTLNLPPPQMLNNGQLCSYHIVGDDAFPLRKDLMKPFPHRNLEREKQIFNYRLSRARRVVENAFGILANRFRVFLTCIALDPDKVESIILAACCLHNYLVHSTPATVTDLDDLIPGDFGTDLVLTGLESTRVRNPPQSAKDQRDMLKQYFVSDVGSVDWQNDIIV